MVININGKEYEIRFGIGFVRSLDKKYFTKGVAGTEFGVGLETRIPMLLAGDAVVLSELLYEGTCHLKSRPSTKDVDEYIDSVDDIDAFFDDVLEELKKQNATRKKVTAIENDWKIQNAKNEN